MPTGLLYVVSLVCGLASPLTNAGPTTLSGGAVVLLVTPWAVSLTGLLIGLVSLLGWPSKLLCAYERLWARAVLALKRACARRQQPASSGARDDGGDAAERGDARGARAGSRAGAELPLRWLSAEALAFATAVLVLTPMGVMAASALLGLSIAAAEGWALSDGALWVMGSMAMLPNPLTDVAPTTGGGLLLGVLNALYTLSAVVVVFGISAQLR